MDAFPAFFSLAGRTVIVAGFGAAAEAKARLFDGSPAKVARLDGEGAFDPNAYAGAALAFVAHEDDSFALRAAEAARAAHVPVNVVDRPELCDFTTPALVDRGEVVAAIGTGGASPMLASLMRHDLEARVPEGAGRVAALLRTLQDEIRQAIPDLPLRRAFLRAAISGSAAEAATAGDMALARSRLREALARGAPPQGLVTFVRGSGPAERLTLGAARALAAADVLVVDQGVASEVLALARRDAEREESGRVTAEHVIELADRGLQVVRLTGGEPSAEELRGLAELGAEVRIAPVA